MRLHCNPRTKDYLAKRIKDGKSKTEAIRCLKRYIAAKCSPPYPYPPPLDSRSIGQAEAGRALSRNVLASRAWLRPASLAS